MEIATILVQHTSCTDVNLTDGVGKTALHYAVKGNYLELATMLVQHASCKDINLKDGDGDGPCIMLQKAIVWG